MADGSKIEWCDSSWNPIRARNRETGGVGHYCVHVSEGCRNCYAERMQPRFRNPIRYAAQDREKVDLFLDEKTLTQPLHWRKPRHVFVCSMTDLFLDDHLDEWIDCVFAVMALAPQHVYQVLTKRPERMREYLTDTEVGMRHLCTAAELGLAPPRWRAEKQKSRICTSASAPSRTSGSACPSKTRPAPTNASRRCSKRPRRSGGSVPSRCWDRENAGAIIPH